MRFMLTEDEVEHYVTQGYVVPRFRMPDDRLKVMERRLERLLADSPDLGTDYIPGLVERDLGWLSFAREPAILDAVEQVIGPDIALWGSGFFGKPAHDGIETPWHQDGDYWPIRPLATVTVWIALDDSTPENGCLRVVPGSHREGKLVPHVTGKDGDYTLHQAVADEAAAEAHGVDVVLRRGQISLHDVFLIHGSKPNRSPRARRGIVYRLMPTTSYFDRDLARIQTQEFGVPDLSQRQLHLMRGTNRCGRNNFNVGRESKGVKVFG
jgi:ectoine hydroxylase-related dioxygenase (phytanoyl-CoA dioxygenase family)